MESIIYSLVIPVYKNEQSIPDLLESLKKIDNALDGQLEIVFVVDGSPDQSYALLRDRHTPNKEPRHQFFSIAITYSGKQYI